VILLTVDTLRADGLSSFGSKHVQTPNMDALAQDGILFSHCFSAAPWTLPSVASIMTGVSPRTHGAMFRTSTLPSSIPTIAQYFEKAGYHTGAVGFNAFLRASSGINKGFEEYKWNPPLAFGEISRGGSVLKYLAEHVCHLAWDGNTTRLTDDAIEWLGEHRDERFFFWLHLYDPHLAFTPPRKYLPPEARQHPGGPLTFDDLWGVRKGTTRLDASGREWVQTLYESEIRYVDAEIGRLVKSLKEMDLYDDTLLVFTSDHGEEFWEHNGFDHGHAMYNELLHVPLVIKLPGNSVRLRCSAPVTNEDVLPTMLNQCGLAFDADAMEGVPLQGYWEHPDSPPAQKPLYATGLLYFGNQEEITVGHMKYIRSLTSGREQLFDLSVDPGEHHSILGENEHARDAAITALEKVHDKANRLRAHYGLGKIVEEKPMNVDQMEMLRSVGYL